MIFYRCPKCGKIIALVDGSKSIPTICCGAPMMELVPNTQDGAHEKHIPVVKQEGNIVTVTVGEVEHPMIDVHYIQWIVLRTNFGNRRRLLSPNEKPMARFVLDENERVLEVLEYCNLHGLYSISL